jgi:hypothetical protein
VHRFGYISLDEAFPTNHLFDRTCGFEGEMISRPVKSQQSYSLSQDVPAANEVKESDQLRWKAWQVRNALRDRQDAAFWHMAVKCTGLAVLVIATILWGNLGPYHVAIRFTVSVGALVVAALSLRSHRYGFAFLFAAITLIYNPIVTVFEMTGESSYTIIALTALVFAGSLIWPGDQPVRNRSRDHVSHQW